MALKKNALLISFAFSIIAIAVSLWVTSRVMRMPKIGIVDNTTLSEQFTDAISARRELQGLRDQWERNSVILEDSIKAAVDDMTKHYDAASRQKKAEMASRLQHWNEEYTKYTKATRQISEQREKEIMTPVIGRMNAFLATWAQTHGYDVLIGTGSGGVILSVDRRWNVTAQVLSDLNRLYSGTPSVMQDDQAKKAVNDSIKASVSNNGAKEAPVVK